MVTAFVEDVCKTVYFQRLFYISIIKIIKIPEVKMFKIFIIRIILNLL